MWLVACLGFLRLPSIAAGWRTTSRGQRLLALWVLLALAEMIVHDSGNERRYVMLVPPLVALASLTMFFRWAPSGARLAAGDRLLLFGVVAISVYLAAGTVLRPLFLGDITAGHFRTPVRLTAIVALTAAAAWAASQARSAAILTPRRVVEVVLLAALAVIPDVTAFVRWARTRTETNYTASVALGQLLPPATWVQGKLANGLSLENRIKPLFVGNGFGNYRDRLARDDVRYILTYDLPRLGYESSDGSGLIQGILDHYPEHRSVATLPVDETPQPERAALIDKFSVRRATHAPD
jgi:hypothetical protein